MALSAARFTIWASEMLRFGRGRQQQGRSAAPAPAGVGRRRERNGPKLERGDKGSLTEQQTEGTATTTIQIITTQQ